MTRSLALPLAILASLFLATAPAHAEESPLTLDDAVALAVAANPGLAAVRLALPISQAAIGVAKQIPNPDLSLEETRETPHDALTLMFPIETAGKRRHRIGVAQAGAGTGEAELSRAVLDLRIEVRRAYYALCAAERAVKEAQELSALAARGRDAMDERYRSGDAPRLELLQTQMAAAQTANEAVTAQALFETQRAALNVLLGRDPSAPTRVNGDLGDGSVPDLETATARAMSASGDLAVTDGRIREQTARVSLARAQRWPDFGLQGAVTHDAPGEFDWGWRAGVSLTLPLFHHHAAEARLEEATLAQLTAQREAQVASMRGAILSAWTLADARGRQYARYRDEILGIASEVERMADDSFRSGQTGLVAMIQAITAVRDTRNRAIEAGLAYQNALADLEGAMGAPLP